MSVSIVYVTYNRLEYTKISLGALLQDNVECDLYLWDNGSNDGTIEYLNEIKDPRIKGRNYSNVNVGPTAAMNYYWGKVKTEYVSKVDNDCKMSPNWTEKLVEAHRDIPILGAIACWHFREQDFLYEIAKEKIQNINGHSIIRHPWVCGTGFIIKRETYNKIGPLKEGAPKHAMTDYFMKVALNGYINGWYYPLVLQDHMDDPLSKYTLLKCDKDIVDNKQITYGLREHNINSMDDRMKRRSMVLYNLMRGSIDPVKYLSRKYKIIYILKNGINKIFKSLRLSNRITY